MVYTDIQMIYFDYKIKYIAGILVIIFVKRVVIIDL